MKKGATAHAATPLPNKTHTNYSSEETPRVLEGVCLFNMNGLSQLGLLLGGNLREKDTEDAILNLGGNLVLVDIVRQGDSLLEVRDVEVMTQEVILLLVLRLLHLYTFSGFSILDGLRLLLWLALHRDHEVVVGVDGQVEVLLRESGNAELNLEIQLRLGDVDLRIAWEVLIPGIVDIVKHIVEQHWEKII